jgi:transposase InsO family protein
MEERMKFVTYYLTGEWSMTLLCWEFGISRKTGYKIIQRFVEEGVDGLKDRSRARHNHANAISESVEATVLEARQSHPTWGPRKLRAWLSRRYDLVNWPAASTIGELLRHHGLTVPRRRSRKMRVYTEPFVGCDHANAVWSADLKGWFATGDGRRCDPLTITDNYSRYLLRCQAVTPADHEAIKPVFEAAFMEYGLPTAIRTDNGPPFATTTVGGLSRLSIWWLKLGIVPERIEPGKPAQNGRHERMHRTLKKETASPPKKTWRMQQEAFNLFRDEYNNERPHEAIGQQTPAERYRPSPQPYPLILPEMTYPEDMVIRSVKSQGDISWKAHHVYLSETLAGEIIGLRQLDDHIWDIYFGPIRLAQLDSHHKRLIHLPRKPNWRTENSENKNLISKKVLPMCPV